MQMGRLCRYCGRDVPPGPDYCGLACAGAYAALHPPLRIAENYFDAAAKAMGMEHLLPYQDQHSRALALDWNDTLASLLLQELENETPDPGPLNVDLSWGRHAVVNIPSAAFTYCAPCDTFPSEANLRPDPQRTNGKLHAICGSRCTYKMKEDGH